MRIAIGLLPTLGALLFLPTLAPATAADYGSAPMATIDPATIGVHEALSRFLSLEMIRVTFDVVSRDELSAQLEAKFMRWNGGPPSAAEVADIDQQLLAEASYYIVSLTYLVQVGGAIFPADKAEAVYTNDTIARLDELRRELFTSVAEGTDVLPILTEVEQIRALTEGYRAMPEGFGIFDQHDQLLDQILDDHRRTDATPA